MYQGAPRACRLSRKLRTMRARLAGNLTNFSYFTNPNTRQLSICLEASPDETQSCQRYCPCFTIVRAALYFSSEFIIKKKNKKTSYSSVMVKFVLFIFLSGKDKKKAVLVLRVSFLKCVICDSLMIIWTGREAYTLLLSAQLKWSWNVSRTTLLVLIHHLLSASSK